MSGWPVPLLSLLLMSAANPQLEQIENRLKDHVRYLAEEVGERNSFLYENLEHSRQYIEQTLASVGYSISNDIYSVNGALLHNSNHLADFGLCM